MEYEGVMEITLKATESFWQRVDVRGESECWPWLASADRQGRGKFWVEGTGRHYPAPRVALMIASGESPPSTTFACHSCDNPSCCNPKHLWWGNRSENMRDCGAKGRHGFQTTYSGSNNPSAKLTDEQVRAMRAKRSRGASCAQLAREFGVRSATVWKIVTGRAWKHVA